MNKLLLHILSLDSVHWLYFLFITY